MKHARNGKYVTTREAYKTVKRYDHEQFDEFCTNIYKEGYEDGRYSVPGVDVEKVMEKISTVKGIGSARIAQIRAVLEELFK